MTHGNTQVNQRIQQCLASSILKTTNMYTFTLYMNILSELTPWPQNYNDLNYFSLSRQIVTVDLAVYSSGKQFTCPLSLVVVLNLFITFSVKSTTYLIVLLF